MKRMPIILLILCCGYPFTQHTNAEKLYPKNFIYLEAGGVGGYGSVNYERNIYQAYKSAIGFRIGLSTYSLRDFTNRFNPDLVTPISINATYGGTHKIEYGVGKTLSNIVQVDFDSFEPKRFYDCHTQLSIGYRYQKNEKGFLFRLMYTPIVMFNKYYQHWGGISFGYAF